MKGKQFLAGMGGSWTPKTVLREGGSRIPPKSFFGEYEWGIPDPQKIVFGGRGGGAPKEYFK